MSAADLLALHHRPPGFILPNAWDPGSARLLESAGFEAIATTSAGISFAAGRPDATLSRDEMLAAVRRIAAAVAVPVSADLEAGYGDTPDEVAATVTAALDAGAAGGNLEDATGGAQFDRGVAAERIAAARAVAPSNEFVLNARIDTFLLAAATTDALDDAVVRGAEYVAAGADCIFLPGLNDLDLLREACRRIEAPVNAVVGLGTPVHDARSLWDAGVTRITVGGSLSRAAFAVVLDAAEAMRTTGTFDFAHTAIPHASLQARFATPTADTDERP